MNKKFLLLILSLLIFAVMISLTACRHEHSFNDINVEPTCTEQGYTKHTCSCGYSYANNYVEALDHSYNLPTYFWDNDKCTAIRICDRDSTHIQMETAAGNYVIDTSATCAINEKGHYVATFKNTSFLQQETEENSIVTENISNHIFENYISNGDADYQKDGTKTAKCIFNCGTRDTIEDIGSALDYTKGLKFSSVNGGYSVIGFSNGFSASTIIIPSTYNGLPVVSIGPSAFFNCAMWSVQIPESIEVLCDSAFDECYHLTKIEIPSSVTSIGHNVFNNCDSLTSVSIPNSVTRIGDNVFSGCENLEYNIKDNLKYLGNDNNPYIYLADTTSTSISTATINEKCKFINALAFKYCSNLTNIVLPNSLIGIGDRVFSSCSKLVYNTKDNLKYLGNSENPYLYLADTTTSYLTTTLIDNNCRFVGSNAFSNCSKLTNITIPDSVIEIGAYAFSNCDNLTNICIPARVIKIGERAFYSCEKLINIEVSADNKYYCDIDGNLYNKEKTILIQYATGKEKTKFIIPNSVTIISDSAFYECKNLSIINTPSCLTNIEEYAFYSCSNLKSIVLSKNIAFIDDFAFNNCSSFENVYFVGNYSEWKKPSIGLDNTDFTSATIYYYSAEKPKASGNYWHYLDGEVVIWE